MTGFPLGLPVLVTPGVGGYAQYVVVPATAVIPLPHRSGTG